MKKIRNTKKANKLVTNTKVENRDQHLMFSFSNFMIKPLNMKNFNNYYKDKDEYIRKITTFVGKMLPLLSNEKISLFEDYQKMNRMHLHSNQRKLSFEQSKGYFGTIWIF